MFIKATNHFDFKFSIATVNDIDLIHSNIYCVAM